jgi:hypothetical protein
MTEQTDHIVTVSDKPAMGLRQWQLELENCLNDAPRRAWRRCEETRYCQWEGQSEDGRKHADDLGEEAQPWENASDGRYFITDGIIAVLSAVCSQALTGGKLTAVPRGMEDQAKGAWITRVLEHYRQAGREMAETEAEISANWMNTLGLCVLQTGWRDRVTRTYVEITMDQVYALASRLQAAAALPSFIADPSQETSAVEIAQSLYPQLPREHVRQAIRDLRSTGRASVPQTKVVESGPTVRALKVGEDVFFPAHTGDLASARWIARREFYGEVDLREKVITEGWSEEWVEAVLASCKGDRSQWANNTGSRAAQVYSSVSLPEQEEIEVFYVYRRQVDDYGVPQMTLTICCVHVIEQDRKELVAWHGILPEAEGTYDDFVCLCRERTERRLVDSRGVPDITAGLESEYKGNRDALRDLMSLNVLPPVATIGARVPHRIAPGQPVKMNRMGEVAFLELGNERAGDRVFQLCAIIERGLAWYFGLMHPEVPPAHWQLMLKQSVVGYFRGWREIHRRKAKLIAAKVPMPQLARIAGQPPAGMDWEAVEYDVFIDFDLKDLDSDVFWKKLESITKGVLPIDTGGNIDRTKLVKLILEAINPGLARAIMTDDTAAAQVLFKQVREDLAQMALGNTPMWTQNDPTAARKLDMAKGIIGSNPKYQAALGQLQPQPGQDPAEIPPVDERFRILVEKYEQNLQQSVKQEKNKMNGRLGVNPEDAA